MPTDHSPASKPTPTQPSIARPTVPPRSLVERVASLETLAQRLTEQADKNNAVIMECIQITEARQWMIMSALDDIMSARCSATTDGEGKLTGVDWEHYKGAYLEYQTKLEAPPVEETKDETEGDIPPDAVVFGGG